MHQSWLKSVLKPSFLGPHPRVSDSVHLGRGLRACMSFIFLKIFIYLLGASQWCYGKESACQAGDTHSIHGLERSSGVGNDSLTPVFLPGKIPWTEEPSRLQSTGLQRVRPDWATEHTYTFIYLAVLGLNCSTQDLHCHVGSCLVAHRLSSCGVRAQSCSVQA